MKRNNGNLRMHNKLWILQFGNIKILRRSGDIKNFRLYTSYSALDKKDE